MAAEKFDVLVKGEPLTWEAAVRLAPPAEETVLAPTRLGGTLTLQFDEARALPGEYAQQVAAWLRERGVEYELRAA